MSVISSSQVKRTEELPIISYKEMGFILNKATRVYVFTWADGKEERISAESLQEAVRKLNWIPGVSSSYIKLLKIEVLPNEQHRI